MESNEERILKHLFFHPGAIRKDIIEDLRLRRNTVTAICAGLIKKKEVLEINGGNKKNIALKLNPEKFCFLGVRHFRDTLTFAALNSDSDIFFRKEIPILPDISGMERLDLIASKVSEILKSGIKKRKILKIGFGDIGMVDQREGKALMSVILPGWENLNVRDAISSSCGIPASVFNSVDSLCAAELLDKRVERDFVFLTADAGIGLSVVIDGKLFRGSCGIAGEMGHVTLSGKSDICACGKRGCLETVAGREAVVRKLKDNSGSNTKSINLEQIIKEARKGHKLSLLVVREAAEALGEVLAGFINIIGISNVVVSTVFSPAGKIFFKPLEDALKKNCIYPLNNKLTVRESSYENASGAEGAACLVLKEYFTDLKD